MKKNNKGFSLVELIIVIAIMAVLIGLLAPQYLRFVAKSKKSADVSNAQALATAVNVAFADGKISATDSGLNGNGGTAITTGKMKDAGVLVWPEAKSVDKASNWKILIGSDGVTKITLGGDTKEIWPSPCTDFQQ